MNDKRPKPTEWVVWRRDKDLAIRLANELIARNISACVLPDLVADLPGYFVHVRPENVTGALLIINNLPWKDGD